MSPAGRAGCGVRAGRNVGHGTWGRSRHRTARTARTARGTGEHGAHGARPGRPAGAPLGRSRGGRCRSPRCAPHTHAQGRRSRREYREENPTVGRAHRPGAEPDLPPRSPARRAGQSPVRVSGCSCGYSAGRPGGWAPRRLAADGAYARAGAHRPSRAEGLPRAWMCAPPATANGTRPSAHFMATRSIPPPLQREQLRRRPPQRRPPQLSSTMANRAWRRERRLAERQCSAADSDERQRTRQAMHINGPPPPPCPRLRPRPRSRPSPAPCAPRPAEAPCTCPIFQPGP